MASGIFAQPYVIRKIVRDSGEVAADHEHNGSPVSVDACALSLIQEGLRSLVRMPTGTAHALESSGFPIPVMGKTGTTNDFRDALFVAPLTALRELPSPSVSTLTTTVPSDQKKPVTGLTSGVQRNSCSECTRKAIRACAGISGPNGTEHS